MIRARKVAAIAAAALSLACFSAHAQQYPTKPVRVIIPFPPGGPTDIMGRFTADTLTKTYGQQFVADNRAGAGGNIGMEVCAKSPPDGYTVCIMTVAQSIAPAIYRKLPFEPIRDFAHVTLLAQLPSMLTVHPSLPVKNVKDLVALAKSKPGQLSYASTGNGTSPHMLMEMFKYMSGTDIVHVPYKGQAPAVLDQISGQVQTAFNTAIGVIPHVKSGRLRGIAISTRERFPAMPELPSVEESGIKGFDGGSWNGVVMPAGTPQDIVNKIHAPVAAALRSPAGKEAMLLNGAIAVGSSPAEFAAYIKVEAAKWAKVAKFAKIQLD
ncbi:MAG TPA: tripartite tricarboxylate transporter substrate binding protein [Burkholderiales bacterium]|jgi:tripartite-type tricarboxylate transporter receptor subunit TctC|nr:tripartite tricarboxylate transporter substrate binding protein [Burkholderiales bacterium]